MKKKPLLRIVALLGISAFAAISSEAVAHHSSTMFNRDKEVTFKGIVKEFQFTNPHAWLLVDVKGADGKETTWGFETAGPNNLMRSGIRKGDLPPGTEVTVSGYPMRDGRPAAEWTKAVRLSDNKEFSPKKGAVLQKDLQTDTPAAPAVGQ